MAKEQDQEKGKPEEKIKKKLVIEPSTLIMIICLILIFATTVANKAGILPAWLVWPILIIFLAIMIIMLFLPKREKKSKV